jgi:acetyl/propionyl-CoA carboxylase alpha subunit
VLGVKTTIPFHRWLMQHPAFVAGDLDTELVAREWNPSDELPADLAERAAILAAFAEHLGQGKQRQAVSQSGEADSRWLGFARRAGLRMP